MVAEATRTTRSGLPVPALSDEMTMILDDLLIEGSAPSFPVRSDDLERDEPDEPESDPALIPASMDPWDEDYVPQDEPTGDEPEEEVSVPQDVTPPSIAPVVSKPEPVKPLKVEKTLAERIAAKERLIAKLTVLAEEDEDLADSVMEAQIDLYALREEQNALTELSIMAANIKSLQTKVEMAGGADPAMVEEYQTILGNIAKDKEMIAAAQEAMRLRNVRRVVLEKEIKESKKDSPQVKEAEAALVGYVDEVNKKFNSLRAVVKTLQPEDNPARGVKAAVQKGERPARTGSTAKSGMTDRVWSGNGAKVLLEATMPDGGYVFPRSEDEAVTMSELWDRLADAESRGQLESWLQPGMTFRRQSSPDVDSGGLRKGVEKNGYYFAFIDVDGDESATRYWAMKK